MEPENEVLGVLVMPIIIPVKGFGEVSFPDGTSQKEIEDALKQLPKDIIEDEDDFAKRQAQIAGAGVGAAYSFGVPATQKVVGKLGESWRGAPTPAAPPAGATPPSAAPLSAAPDVSREILRERPPIEPAGGRGTYNWARRFGLSPIEASRSVEMGRNVAASGAQNLIDLKAAQEPMVQRLLPGAKQNVLGMYVPTEETRGQSFVQEAGGKLRELPPAKPVATGLSPLQRVSQLFSQMMETPVARGAGAAMRVAAPPLALASAFGQAHDIYTEQQKEEEERDRLKQILAAAGVLGTGMMMVPGGQIPGAALAIGAPLAQEIRERFSR